MPVIKVTKKFFSGTSKVFDGTLATILRALIQNQAVTAASSIAALTDNGGGASNGVIEAIPALVNYQLVGMGGAGKGTTEAAFLTASDALSEVVHQLGLIQAKVPFDAAIVNNIGGTAPDGTVGAITQTVAGVNAALVLATGAIAAYNLLTKGVIQAAALTNELAVAVGLAPIVLPVDPGVGPYSTFTAIAPFATGVSPSGADATNANATLSAVEVDAALVWLANSIKEMTAKLAAVHTATPTISVVLA